MTYLYETPSRPARLALTVPGQPSLTLPVDPALYAGLRQLALMHEGLFLAWAQMAVREMARTLGEALDPALAEEAWITEPPARGEEPLTQEELDAARAPSEDEDFPF